MADEKFLQVVGTAGIAARILQAEGTSIAISVRHPVHVGHEWSESGLVWHYLACKRHRKVSPAMEGICKGDDAVSFGKVPGDLDGIFNGLSAARWRKWRSWGILPARAGTVFPQVAHILRT